MATLGYTTTPSFGNFWFGVNVQNEVYGGTYAMPAGGGLITALHAYFDVETGGPATCWLCLWDGAGTLLASVAVGGIPTGSNSAGGQAWHSGTLATPIYVAGGTNIFPGFSVPRANGLTTSFDASGASAAGTNTSPPGAFSSGALTGHGVVGAYVDYLPVSAHILRGGAWVQCNGVDVLRSSAWASLQELEIERSSTWGPTT